MFRIFSLLLLLIHQVQAAEMPPNVLFIIVDDLAPVSTSFGGEVDTPSIDELASRGIAFQNNYANVPVCGASRASMLSGLRPSGDRFLTFNSRLDQDVPEALTIPGHFRANGWYTVGYGKIFDVIADSTDSSWSEPVWSPSPAWHGKDVDERGEHLQKAYIDDAGEPRPRWFERLEVDDTEYPDGQVAEQATADINRLEKGQQPFFMAVGFRKPHLPFNVPDKYWRESFSDLLPETWHQPGDEIPRLALHRSLELRLQYDALPLFGDPSDEKAAEIVAGYHAAVRYADAQVGRVLDALDESGVADNTIIVLMGDHGFFLAEQQMWTKHALLEPALRTPLIIAAPGSSQGSSVEAVTDLLDVFPTLTELSGIETPNQLQGASLKPLIDQTATSHKAISISRWLNGESVRDQSFRYTRWFDADNQTLNEMLFDLIEDPHETQNIVSAHREVASRLRSQLDSARIDPNWSEPLGAMVTQLGVANSSVGSVLVVAMIYPLYAGVSGLLLLAVVGLLIRSWWRRRS